MGEQEVYDELFVGDCNACGLEVHAVISESNAKCMGCGICPPLTRFYGYE